MFKLVIPNPLHLGCVSESLLVLLFFILFYCFSSYSLVIFTCIFCLRIVIFSFGSNTLFTCNLLLRVVFYYSLLLHHLLHFLCLFVIFSYRVVTLFNQSLFICNILHRVVIYYYFHWGKIHIFLTFKSVFYVCFNGMWDHQDHEPRPS